jgi:soluble P-type ATPase
MRARADVDHGGDLGGQRLLCDLLVCVGNAANDDLRLPDIDIGVRSGA